MLNSNPTSLSMVILPGADVTVTVSDVVLEVSFVVVVVVVFVVFDDDNDV